MEGSHCCSKNSVAKWEHSCGRSDDHCCSKNSVAKKEHLPAMLHVEGQTTD